MVITTKKMYSEVYWILKALGDKYINKLPKTVLKVITESKEENYNPEYSMSIPLKEEETISEKVDRFVESSNQSTANIVEYKKSFFNKIIDKIKKWFNIFK